VVFGVVMGSIYAGIATATESAALGVVIALALGSALVLAGAESSAQSAAPIVAQIGVPVVPKDAFPFFDNPKMMTVAEAESRRLVFERDMVIGVARGREAKAYPITIMGVHELGNDTIDGVPIAVTW
jgi:hypothetical protein